MKKYRKHTIWQNIDLNYEDWRADLEEYYPDEDGYDEDDRQEFMYERNNDYLDDERMNLDVDISAGIIAIADLGLWYGRRVGYKEMGHNISDCLYSECDYAEWYVDERGDFRFTGHHHDGTNCVVYRAWKDGITDEQKEVFEMKCYEGKVTPQDITRYTRRLGDDIARVYGWEIRPKGGKHRIARGRGSNPLSFSFREHESARTPYPLLSTRESILLSTEQMERILGV